MLRDEYLRALRAEVDETWRRLLDSGYDRADAYHMICKTLIHITLQPKCGGSNVRDERS